MLKRYFLISLLICVQTNATQDNDCNESSSNMIGTSACNTTADFNALIANTTENQTTRQNNFQAYNLSETYGALAPVFQNRDINYWQHQYTCSYCYAQFKHQSSLKLHRYRRHPIYTCNYPNCNKSFQRKQDLDKHKVTHIYTVLQDGQEDCSICYTDKADCKIVVCNHVICESCLTTWLKTKNTCPFCRTELIHS